MMEKQIGHVDSLPVHTANNQLRVARPKRSLQRNPVANLPTKTFHRFVPDDARIFLFQKILNLLGINLGFAEDRKELLGIHGKLRKKVCLVFVNPTEPRQFHHVPDARHSLQPRPVFCR